MSHFVKCLLPELLSPSVSSLTLTHLPWAELRGEEIYRMKSWSSHVQYSSTVKNVITKLNQQKNNTFTSQVTLYIPMCSKCPSPCSDFPSHMTLIDVFIQMSVKDSHYKISLAKQNHTGNFVIHKIGYMPRLCLSNVLLW